MEIVKQLAIFLENKPGALFRLTKDLAEKGINILAISVSDTVDHAVVRLIVDKPEKATFALEETGALVVEKDLLKVCVENKPGKLAEFCGKLEEKGINIEYAYGSCSCSGGEVTVYIRVIDIEQARQKLES